MNKVPKMLSTKDLDYICDMLNWNLTNAKKINQYLEETEDEEIKESLETVIQMFEDHYNFLVGLLK
ncbi:MAG: spore coat protein [Bacilli bacterium]